jgi:multicomponent Na+:H+ antiporter subunit E
MLKRLLNKKKRDEFWFSVIYLFLFWMIISFPSEIWSKLGLIDLAEHIVLGLIISMIVISLYPKTLFTSEEISRHKDLKVLFRLVIYFGHLMIDIFLSGIDVARRVMRKRLLISPGIVQVETPLHADYEIALNANSITLTPGTITIDARKTEEGSVFCIHCISQEAVKSILETGGFVEKIRHIYEGDKD